MAKNSDTPKSTSDGHVSMPLRMPRALEAKVKQASERTGLAKQDVMRLGLDRGIDILLAQLTGAAAPMPAHTAAA